MGFKVLDIILGGLSALSFLLAVVSEEYRIIAIIFILTKFNRTVLIYVIT